MGNIIRSEAEEKNSIKHMLSSNYNSETLNLRNLFIQLRSTIYLVEKGPNI